MKFVSCIALAMICAGFAPSVHAAQLAVTSYSTPNGEGQASGGTYNYWDGKYSGSGATTTDGATLTGGTGLLTDGVISTSPWYEVSNDSGTGQYIGWLGTVTSDPVVTFNFASSANVTDIKIYLDNTQVGGVDAPSAILVDGTSESFTAPAVGTVGLVDLSGLDLTGDQHTVQFDQVVSDSWVFVSEVQFFGAPTAVPEPATWALIVVGFGLVGYGMRKRSSGHSLRAA